MLCNANAVKPVKSRLWLIFTPVWLYKWPSRRSHISNWSQGSMTQGQEYYGFTILGISIVPTVFRRVTSLSGKCSLPTSSRRMTSLKGKRRPEMNRLTELFLKRHTHRSLDRTTCFWVVVTHSASCFTVTFFLRQENSRFVTSVNWCYVFRCWYSCSLMRSHAYRGMLSR